MDFATDLAGAARALTPLQVFNASGYVPELYARPGNVAKYHNRPRFGFTNDFQALLAGIAGEGDGTGADYVKGIIIGSVIVLCVALVWFLAIMGLKAAGQRRVSFFAGRLVRPGPEGDDAARDEKFARTTWIVRVAFVLSGVAVIVAGVVFYAKGAAAFRASFDGVRQGIDLVQEVAYKTADLSRDVLDADRGVEESVPAEYPEEAQLCSLDAEQSALLRVRGDPAHAPDLD